LFSANVYFTNYEEGSIVTLVFRYQDEKNYLALELNPVSANKINLVKAHRGEVRAVVSSNTPISKETWYRFKIVFFNDDIQVI
jgi:hypothetical protein